MKFDEYSKKNKLWYETTEMIPRINIGVCLCGERTKWFDGYLACYVCSSECHEKLEIILSKNADYNRPV